MLIYQQVIFIFPMRKIRIYWLSLVTKIPQRIFIPDVVRQRYLLTIQWFHLKYFEVKLWEIRNCNAMLILQIWNMCKLAYTLS